MNSIKTDYIYRLVNNLLSGNLKQKIFFMHVPKCGGTSISRAIRRNYGFGKKQGTDFFQLDAAASLKASQILGTIELEFFENLLIYNMSIRSRKYIDGHFVYSQKAFESFGDEWKFVTLLRNPVSKWFSKYFYNRYKESLHYKLDCDLETYLESKTGIADGSDYVRCLTGTSLLHNSNSKCAVEQAIGNLDNFALIGVLEKIDVFTRDFERQFDAKLNIKRHRSNPFPKFKQEEQISNRVKKRVEEICQPDIQVYNAALARIEN